MPASTTDDILTLNRRRAYALNHLRAIVTRQDAADALAWLREKKAETFSLSTFYRWKRGGEPSWPMLRALAVVRGYRMVMVKRTDIA